MCLALDYILYCNAVKPLLPYTILPKSRQHKATSQTVHILQLQERAPDIEVSAVLTILESEAVMFTCGRLPVCGLMGFVWVACMEVWETGWGKGLLLESGGLRPLRYSAQDTRNIST